MYPETKTMAGHYGTYPTLRDDQDSGIQTNIMKIALNNVKVSTQMQQQSLRDVDFNNWQSQPIQPTQSRDSAPASGRLIATNSRSKGG